MEQAESIGVKLKGQDGRTLFFKIKPHTHLFKVRDAYCAKKELDPKTVQLLYKGKRVTNKQTPARLGMEDGDEIEVMMHFSGGGGCKGY